MVEGLWRTWVINDQPSPFALTLVVIRGWSDTELGGWAIGGYKSAWSFDEEWNWAVRTYMNTYRVIVG